MLGKPGNLGENQVDISTRLAKRLVDVTLSSILLILTGPLLLVLMGLVRLDSHGAAVFRSERLGLDGKPFTILKFRTMVEGAHLSYEDVVKKNPQAVNGVFFKDPNDDRMTGFGRILRRSSLDELPQLWNVLVGDMSLVGPRPAFSSEMKKLDDVAKKRLSVKPGLTGLWQVSGRSSLPFSKAIELDLHYVDNASIWLDFKILFMTIPAVLSRRGAF